MLTPLHHQMFVVDRGIPLDLLEEEGVRSISSAAELPRTDLPLIHPSLKKLAAGDFLAAPKDSGAGLHLPIRDVHGNETWQYRPDHPRSFPNLRTGKTHVLKYESPKGVRNVIYVPKRVRADVLGGKRRLWVTEGVAKTLAGVAAGLCIVGMTGVSNWKMRLSDDLSVEIPDLADIPVNERVLVTAFDSDAVTNKDVRAAELRWRRQMESLGATVIEVRIPPGPNGEKVGLDDYLAAGGDPEQLVDEAIRRGWWDRPGSVPTPPAGGSDGEQGCRNCQRRAAEEREERSWDLLRKRGGWSPNETAILRHYAMAAESAVEVGKETISANTDNTVHVTGVSHAAITRVNQAYKQLQKDPEVRAVLPFTLAQKDPKPGDYRKPWQIVIAHDEHGQPVAKTAVEMGELLATVSRPKMNPDSQGDGRHGGARWRCSKPDHEQYGVEEAVRKMYRCLAPGCTERWEPKLQVTKIGGADSEEFHHEITPEAAPEGVQTPLPEIEDADPFHHENSPDETVTRFQDDDPKYLTQSRHAENGLPDPVSLRAYAAARSQPFSEPPPRCTAPGCKAMQFRKLEDGSYRCLKSAHDPSVYQLAAVAGGDS
jgi:hypothetical protein